MRGVTGSRGFAALCMTSRSEPSGPRRFGEALVVSSMWLLHALTTRQLANAMVAIARRMQCITKPAFGFRCGSYVFGRTVLSLNLLSHSLLSRSRLDRSRLDRGE